MSDFKEQFKALTGNVPFPWQEALYQRFLQGDIPKSCTLPTGLGKTNVIAIWLIAFANKLNVPSRLVYVVNRRTVVDQTTDEAKKLSDNAGKIGVDNLAISTLRGQFADNREWSDDPSRPAIISGTVDMIGSRLLFSGYGIGRSKKPLHAGFLGQDVLLVHDEAHLEPAFQKLVIKIEEEQACEPAVQWPKFRVMELTATRRGSGEVFELTDADRANAVVGQRINASKKLHFEQVNDEKKLLWDKLYDRAKSFADKKRAVIVFTRTVEGVMYILDKLPANRKIPFTGIMRGKERDGLVEDPLFKRFLPGGGHDGETTWLVCTSAGEVGVNISADHLVCDLSTFESMAQRFGRVNRFGERTDTEIHVVHPTEFKKDDPYDASRKMTLELLKQLEGDGSPSALGKLNSEDRQAAFAPPPTILPATDILFDAWALTTIKGKLPGRPPVEPYLHGVTEDQFDTEFAWREEVSRFTGKLNDDDISEYLDEFPLKPHETLRIPTFGKVKAVDHLEAIAKRNPDWPVWVIEPEGELIVFAKLSQLLEKKGNGKDYLHSLSSRSVILPPKAGGLTANGMLDGSIPFVATQDYDVASLPPANVRPLVRLTMETSDEGEMFTTVGKIADWPENPMYELKTKIVRVSGNPYLILDRFDIPDPRGDQEAIATQFLVLKKMELTQQEKVPVEWPSLDHHNNKVGNCARQIAERLNLDAKLVNAIEYAGNWHDLGKDRPTWQRGAGNSYHEPVAKTLHGRAPEYLNHYRHELGSLVDVQTHSGLAAKFDSFDDELKELVLHLIATHHGRGRPHFPESESHDFEHANSVTESITSEVPARFARLQRKYGRWGLAYLESLLRAADASESSRIEKASLPDEWPLAQVKPKPTYRALPSKQKPAPNITVNVDPTNPGQFFACCGLLELADRLWPGAEGWFGEGGREFYIRLEKTPKEWALRVLLEKLVQHPPTVIEQMESGLGVRPIIAPLSIMLDEGKNIVLDGWARIALVKGKAEVIGNSPWNFWSGQQTSARLWTALRTELIDQLKTLSPDRSELLFFERLFQKGRFGFDPGPAWNALDAGFSPNEQKMEVQSSPTVELLSAVGLQRFRPILNESKDGFDYFSWHSPLSPIVAAAAYAGSLQTFQTRRYRASVVSRGEYAALGYAFQVLTGGSDERVE